MLGYAPKPEQARVFGMGEEVKIKAVKQEYIFCLHQREYGFYSPARCKPGKGFKQIETLFLANIRIGKS